MKLIPFVFIVVLTLTACDDKQETQKSYMGIGPRGVGVMLTEDLCIDPGTGEVMVCWEL